MKVHCLFEQSGSFKNQFIKLGYQAYDYDIEKTDNVDYVVDIFNEIYKAFNDIPSIFDSFRSDDLILAFFPCTNFSIASELSCRGDQFSRCDISLLDKLYFNYDKVQVREYYLETFIRFFIVCCKRKLRLIVENPYQANILLRVFALRPSLVISDRRIYGDCFEKPTMFYSLNFELRDNFVCMPVNNLATKKVYQCKKGDVERSYITPMFAETFIKKHILDQEEFYEIS